MIDFNANVSVIHQLVGRLKAGTIGGTTFAHVVLIGHSLGSATAIAEASTYHDVDGVVVTGALQHYRLAAFSLFQTKPANTDPSHRFDNLPSGYLTTVPNTRGPVFYYAPGSDPAVVQYDEQTKETTTGNEFDFLNPDGTENLNPGGITVPVLDIVGQQDAIFCGSGGAGDGVNCSSSNSVYQEEAPYYSPQAHLQVNVMPLTGHDLNLHYSAQATYGIIIGWLFTHWNGSNQ